MRIVIALSALALVVSCNVAGAVNGPRRTAMLAVYPSGQIERVLEADISFSECNRRQPGWNRGAKLFMRGEWNIGLRAYCAVYIRAVDGGYCADPPTWADWRNPPIYRAEGARIRICTPHNLRG